MVQRLGRYQLLEKLASGGMGEVWLAMQQMGVGGVERLCVVKTVLPELCDTPLALQRFVDEAQTSLLLQHPNVCVTYDVDRHADVLLIAMEYIGGATLRQLTQRAVEADEDIAVDEAVAIARAVLDGLDHAHNLKNVRTDEPLGLVHRDISPQNIMVALTGEVKVIDFGVARSRIQTSRTRDGAFVGKLRYMAPEQLSGRRPDARADVYSVAIVLAELVSGVRFYGDDNDQLVMLHLMTDTGYVSPALSRVPPTLRALLVSALARDPKKRLGSAAAFRTALDAVAAPLSRDALRRMFLRLWPGADLEERDFLRGALGQTGSARRGFDDETVRLPPVAPPAAPPAAPRPRPRAPEVTPDASTIRRPLGSAAHNNGNDGNGDDDDDATERVALVVPAALPAAQPPTAPSRPRPTLTSTSASATSTSTLSSSSAPSSGDGEDATEPNLGRRDPTLATPPRAPKMQKQPIVTFDDSDDDDDDDPTLRSLPDVDAPAGSPSTSSEPPTVKRWPVKKPPRP